MTIPGHGGLDDGALVDALIERSSLGMPAARELRADPLTEARRIAGLPSRRLLLTYKRDAGIQSSLTILGLALEEAELQIEPYQLQSRETAACWCSPALPLTSP